jgi:hypothetical protein
MNFHKLTPVPPKGRKPESRKSVRKHDKKHAKRRASR